jgi:CDP-4-dehydro-6-deoxyglucose reductase
MGNMKKIKLHPSGKEIDYNSEDTVLSCLEKYGYALPNNCRAGACGECKIKVVSGQFDQGLILSMALSAKEKTAGYGLMCMAKVTSDVLEIEFGSEDAKPKLFPPKENATYIIVSKNFITPAIVKIKLWPLGQGLKFWPGQFVTIGGGNTGKPQRSYSIANTPNHRGEIELMISKIKGGVVSEWIHDQLKEGDHLALSGPYGTFIGDPTLETPVLCLAAGSGLAPIHSLTLAALMRGGFKYPVDILFSAKTPRDLIEIGTYKFLEAKFRNFRFRYTLTKEQDKGGLQGRITEVLPKLFPDLQKYSVYIAGSTGFVDDCQAIVKRLGCPEKHVFTEGFHPQK